MATRNTTYHIFVIAVVIDKLLLVFYAVQSGTTISNRFLNKRLFGYKKVKSCLFFARHNSSIICMVGITYVYMEQITAKVNNGLF